MDLALAHDVRRSNWIRCPWTWDRIGTEADYIFHLASEVRCCACNGTTRVHAVTVMTYPTRYPWAPLCDPCDWLLRSQGAAKLKARIIGPRADGITGRDYLEYQRTEHAAAWAFERLPRLLNADGWAGLTRKRLTEWALREGIYAELLSCWRTSPADKTTEAAR